MSNIDTDWLFIDASQSAGVLERGAGVDARASERPRERTNEREQQTERERGKENDGDRARERNGRQNTRRYT